MNTVDESVTFQCSLECVHGECIFPGLCACDAGWRGDQCDTGQLDILWLWFYIINYYKSRSKYVLYIHNIFFKREAHTRIYTFMYII